MKIFANLFSILLVIAWSAPGFAKDVENAKDSPFLIKPFLFSIQGHQIAVGWQYKPERTPTTQALLQLYRHGQPAAQLTPSVDQEYQYAVLPIANCGFGQDLSYSVSGMDEASSIDEIPCSDSKDPFSFFFLADSQQGTDEVAKFAKLMRTIPGAAVLHGGDIVHKGTDFEMWTSYFDSMSTIEKSKILFPAVGNHEYLRDQAVPLWKRFFRYEARDAHYSFDLGAAHVIALNSNFDYDPNQKGDQIAWLKSELAVPAKWKIVYFHHPGYSEGIANSPVAPRKEHVFVQSTLIPLFEENHVDLVLNGHVHLFETSVKNGIRYLTVGPAGGKMGLKGGKNPYLLKGAKKRTIAEISVSPAKIEAKSLGIDGELVDEFEIKK